MKTIILIVIAMSLQYICRTQNVECDQARLSVVIADSGVNLRERPSVKSQKIITIPRNERVITCRSAMQPEMQIEGVKGTWIKSSYQGYEGYIFSSYLSVLKCEASEIRIVVPDDGSMDNFPLTIFCDPYQGVYGQNSDNTRRKHYEVKPIEIVDTMVDYRMKYLGQMADLPTTPKFLISGLNIRNKQIEGRLVNKMYFPFEGETLWMDQRMKNEQPIQYMVFANGKGVKNKDENGEAMFESIEDYELWLRIYQQGQSSKEILIYRENLHHFVGGEYEGGAWIYWIGDLNNDNIPDLIVKTSSHYAGWTYKLLLSNPSNNSEMYDIIVVGGGSSC